MKPLKTCLKSLHNPVHIHMRPALPRSSVDNPHVVNTIIHTFSTLFHFLSTACQNVAFRLVERGLPPHGRPPFIYKVLRQFGIKKNIIIQKNKLYHSKS